MTQSYKRGRRVERKYELMREGRFLNVVAGWIDVGEKVIWLTLRNFAGDLCLFRQSTG